MKNTKYRAKCRAAGYAFVPFALSTGGRSSPCALKLLRMMCKAAEDQVDSWYFWGALVPRLYAALAIGMYERAVATRRAVYAAFAARRPGGASDAYDEERGPPSPVESHARVDFEDTYDCDARWAWHMDGSGTFGHETSLEYSVFLRETHPEFFESSA